VGLGRKVDFTIPPIDDVAPSTIVPDEAWSAALVSFSFCLVICDPLIAPAIMLPMRRMTSRDIQMVY
jgi:hypothetical protein